MKLYSTCSTGPPGKLMQMNFMSQQGALATYLIPGCVGRGVRLGSENSSGGGAGAWKSGNLEIWGPGHPEIWGPTNQKVKVLKIQIRSAQNVVQVWISRKKILLALFGAIWGHFFHGPEKSKQCRNFAYVSLVGPLLLSRSSLWEAYISPPPPKWPIGPLAHQGK